MMKPILLFFILCFAQWLEAQKNYDIHWVSFKDKKGSPYSIFAPQQFLSARALERRQAQGIGIDSSDLPINPHYIQPITDMGYPVHYQSKWLNGIGVVVSQEHAEDIAALPFVKSVRPIGILRKSQHPKTGVGARDYKNTYTKNKSYYGSGLNQIAMLNGHYIHAMGFKGAGMHVAVMDGGFNFMPETPAFDSIFAKKQILQTYDFLERDNYVFESSEHGTDVLSTMAANLPYLFVGTSPEAYFYLYKTEDEFGELVQEEYAWVTSLEYADSIGVSVVNTSLGYYDFDDNDMDYGFDDLRGKYSPMSIAAGMAVRKGIVVVTSAGNEGDNDWKHITVPGDAPDILTIGAVDRDGFRAKFSSMGFSKSPYIKPDLMARGHTAVVAYRGRYDTRYQFGTSFSSPIMAGMITSFWQACPQATAKEVIATLRKSGSQFEKPDTSLGYGVPDFFRAYQELSPTVVLISDSKITYHRHYGTDSDYLDVFLQKSPCPRFEVELVDALQRSVYRASADALVGELAHHRLPVKDLPSGIYTVYVRLGEATHRVLVAINGM